MIKVRQSGTHVILRGNIKGIEKTLVIPIHHREIAEGTMTDILNNQAEISREEFFILVSCMLIVFLQRAQFLLINLKKHLENQD